MPALVLVFSPSEWLNRACFHWFAVMGIFFNEFNHYKTKSEAGQVFTPEHIHGLHVPVTRMGVRVRRRIRPAGRRRVRGRAEERDRHGRRQTGPGVRPDEDRHMDHSRRHPSEYRRHARRLEARRQGGAAGRHGRVHRVEVRHARRHLDVQERFRDRSGQAGGPRHGRVEERGRDGGRQADRRVRPDQGRRLQGRRRRQGQDLRRSIRLEARQDRIRFEARVHRLQGRDGRHLDVRIPGQRRLLRHRSGQRRREQRRGRRPGRPRQDAGHVQARGLPEARGHRGRRPGGRCRPARLDLHSGDIMVQFPVQTGGA